MYVLIFRFMNKGFNGNEIAQIVKLPPHLINHPYLIGKPHQALCIRNKLYITDAWVDCVDFNLFIKIHLLMIYDFNSLYSFKRANYKKVKNGRKGQTN